jgi:hypothetical protein
MYPEKSSYEASTMKAPLFCLKMYPEKSNTIIKIRL